MLKKYVQRHAITPATMLTAALFIAPVSVFACGDGAYTGQVCVIAGSYCPPGYVAGRRTKCYRFRVMKHCTRCWGLLMVVMPALILRYQICAAERLLDKDRGLV